MMSETTEVYNLMPVLDYLNLSPRSQVCEKLKTSVFIFSPIILADFDEIMYAAANTLLVVLLFLFLLLLILFCCSF